MADIFFISDTHFGHANLLTFTKPDGGLCRPEFQSVEEMDEFMVDQWNRVVHPQAHVYHLGDVAMAKRHIPIVGRCNGKKRLILGNHDEPLMKYYLPYFDKIMSSRLLDNLLLTHIPVHPGSLKEHKQRWTNVHGHVHNNVPRDHYGPAYCRRSSVLSLANWPDPAARLTNSILRLRTKASMPISIACRFRVVWACRNAHRTVAQLARALD